MPVAPSSKWPNDVLIGGRKVAGVLTQVLSGPGGWLVIGVGLNVSQVERDLGGLRSTATSLRLEGHDVDRLSVLVALARSLTGAFEEDPAAVLDRWRSRSTLLGRPVVVARPGEPEVRGRCAALAPDGALVIETAYGPLRILAGEVTVEA